MESPQPTIPIIDIGPLANAGTLREKTIGLIGTACQNWGLFYITGHGLSDDLLASVWRETKTFFALPSAAKQAVVRTKDNSRGWYNRELTKNIRDMKEVFDFGHSPHPNLPEHDPSNWTRDGFNQWPDPQWCSAFRPTLETYFTECERLAHRLLAAIGESLNVTPENLTQAFLGNHTSFLRLNYFPQYDPLTAEEFAAVKGHYGIHPHSDAGALTILLQDDVGGLQICHSEAWIPVKPVQDTLVVNIGDIVQVWSNDLYQAPLHRVAASTTRARYSLPFFYNPSYDTVYAPLDALTDETSPPKYHPINWGTFRWHRQQGDFANYGQENQIADYRIDPGTKEPPA